MAEKTLSHFLFECSELLLDLTVIEKMSSFIGLQKTDKQAAITLLGFKQVFTNVAKMMRLFLLQNHTFGSAGRLELNLSPS